MPWYVPALRSRHRLRQTWQLPSGSSTRPSAVDRGSGCSRCPYPATRRAVRQGHDLHVPSRKQQAPVAAVHGFGSQLVLMPCYVPLQAAWVGTWQAPSTKQHAPVGCGHGFGSQTVLCPATSRRGASIGCIQNRALTVIEAARARRLRTGIRVADGVNAPARPTLGRAVGGIRTVHCPSRSSTRPSAADRGSDRRACRRPDRRLPGRHSRMHPVIRCSYRSGSSMRPAAAGTGSGCMWCRCPGRPRPSRRR